MDALTVFFSSVNKLSFFVFLLGLFFFCFELYILIKEKEKKLKPQIPQFNVKDFDKKNVASIINQPIVKKKDNIISRFNVHLVLAAILFVMTIFFFFLSVVSIKTSKEKIVTKTEVVYSEIQSKGIKLYSHNFLKELNEQDLVRLPSGSDIVIGIETINGADIDRARIKVNEKEWSIKHITTRFDTANKVFYTNYSIATGESKLSIDAQLHSFADGWLGD